MLKKDRIRQNMRLKKLRIIEAVVGILYRNLTDHGD